MLFTYKAIDKDGKMQKGVHEAGDKAQVIGYLKAQHWTPVSVEVGATSELMQKASFLQKKPKVDDLSMFCEQFCSLLRAGITIIDALNMLGDQTNNAVLKQGILNTITGINEGEGLGVAMQRSPKAFDGTLINLVKAGEASGSLDVSLDRMAVQYKKDAHIKATVKKAVSYPIIVMFVAIAVVIFMLLVVVPNFMAMFADIGIEMPKITLMVVAASEWMQQYWYICLAIVALFVVGIMIFKKSEVGHRFFSLCTLKIPGINNFTIKSNAAKIARSLSTLLAAGMSVLEALEILKSTMTNYFYEDALEQVRNEVLSGRQISAKMRDFPNLFPSMLVHMIAVGEDTGDTTSMLTRTADYYDLEVETATETMMTALQPMIILLLTGIVGVLIAAVLAPMVTLYSELGTSI